MKADSWINPTDVGIPERCAQTESLISYDCGEWTECRHCWATVKSNEDGTMKGSGRSSVIFAVK